MANTRIIQYAFGSIGKFWLSAYPGKKDLEVGNIPDLLSVLGRKYKDIFIKEGFQDNKVTVWPAFRYKFNNSNDFKDNRNETLAIFRNEPLAIFRNEYYFPIFFRHETKPIFPWNI